MTQTVLCIKWGRRYGADYVNRLHSMVARHTARPTRLVCYTDDASELVDGIETYPLPEIDLPEEVRWTAWRKVCLWRGDLPGIGGDVLFVDLDVVVTGGLDDFFDHRADARFLVAENWTQLGRGIGNTSAFRFRVGADSYVFERFARDPRAALRAHDNEQIYVSRTIETLDFWPPAWVVSFKHSLLPRWPMNFVRAPALTPDARIVAFTGKPDPDEAAIGRWPERRWWKKTYKHVRPTPWIDAHWR